MSPIPSRRNGKIVKCSCDKGPKCDLIAIVKDGDPDNRDWRHKDHIRAENWNKEADHWFCWTCEGLGQSLSLGFVRVYSSGFTPNTYRVVSRAVTPPTTSTTTNLDTCTLLEQAKVFTRAFLLLDRDELERCRCGYSFDLLKDLDS
jgi:hypothetical protein